jgi:2-polyprenyl-3-methyl-5-hydroxy-6-metoxy-1,4-benzoquinol methylase
LAVPRLTYNPTVFDQVDLDSARRIILTPEGSTTDLRWATETPVVRSLIERTVNPTAQMLILDFGCGVGRIAKELIARRGCSVIGVDISGTMRALATDYVASDNSAPVRHLC